MKKKVLTVTVPSYNVEEFLEECLDSFVCPEIMDEIEVLIVNDGSTDSTAEIGRRYEEEWPGSFRLITKENGGHGSTINRGVEEASGEYFKVVDGDDWVNRKEFVKLVRELKQSRADIVASNYVWIDHETRKPAARQEHPFTEIEYGRLYPFSEVSGKVMIDMHAMTIRTDLLRKSGEKLDEHTFYVDYEYITFPIPYVETVYFMKDTVYCYRLGRAEQSMAISKMQKNVGNHLKVLLRLNHYSEKVRGNVSEDKLGYINDNVAAMLTSQIKIYISFPLGSGMRKEALKLESYFYRKNRDAFNRVKNPAVWLMRRTRYLTFPLAVALFRKRRNSY